MFSERLFWFLKFFALVSSATATVVEREIVILKYKPAQFSRNIANLNGKFIFRFCACKTETVNPGESNDCICSSPAIGKSVRNSLPYAVYRLRCKHSPKLSECLSVSMTTENDQDKLYVNFGTDSVSLMRPNFQRIQVSRYEVTALLEYGINDVNVRHVQYNNDRTELTYIVLSKYNTKYQYKNPFERRLNKLFADEKQFYQRKLQSSRVGESAVSSPIRNIPSNVAEISKILYERSRIFRKNSDTFDIELFKNSVLISHNFYRKKHGVPALSRNHDLDTIAAEWAEHLATSTSCLKHDKKSIYGENLFFFSSFLLPDEDAMGAYATHSLYNEGIDYDYKSFFNLDYKRRGHFTQLIWKSSRQIGIGTAIRRWHGRSTNKCQPNYESHLLYIVMKYDPPGNIQEREYYKNNVLPPSQ